MTSHAVLILIVLTLLLGCEAPTSATKQEGSAQPRSDSHTAQPDLVAETIERCANCHGKDGNLGRNNAPFIGGQQEDYLAFAIRAYINGLRRQAHEQSMTVHLSHAQIDALAQHYAKQPRKWRGAEAGTPHTPSDKRGQQLSRSCVACHGEQGISQRPGIPSIAGLERNYFIKAVNAYIQGDRENELMLVYKSSLNAADISALANHYSRQTAQKTGRATPPPAIISSLTQRCAACHGERGSGVTRGIPHLAGQDKDYLLSATLAYRDGPGDGQRDDAMMSKAVAKLSDQQVLALAQYYSNQQRTPVPFGQLQFGKNHAPLADGERIAASCNGCHHAPQGDTPNLNSLSPVYLQTALKAYQQGTRKHPEMQLFSQHLNDLDIEKVALYYATQSAPKPAQKTLAPGKDIEALLQRCGGCHGADGNSTTATTPSLAGQKPHYLEHAIRAYATAQRPHQAMQDAVAQLGPEQVTALAVFYARQTRQAIEVRIPASAQSIANKCDRCHGINGNGQQTNKPILAGQSERYLVSALKSYQTELRENSTMHAMTELLSNLEIHTIARYYAQQK